MSALERARRTAAADAVCREALATAMPELRPAGTAAVAEPPAIALVAVGGYGRGELAPASDLDVVLVHEDDVPGQTVAAVAGAVWYPLWDSAFSLDHAVRSLGEMTEATADPKVALGLLDARHLSGDPSLTLRLRTALLAQWRREARSWLPELEALVRSRHARVGELGHVAVPDVKESAGGLRDATVLKALVATWLVDVPHADLERTRQQLLDVRDELHEQTGRRSDRIAPEAWGPLAGRLGLADAEEAQRHVRALGRRLTHLSRLTWRRVAGVLATPARPGHRSPRLTTLAPGVAVAGDAAAGEVVLDGSVAPARDPRLLLRAAAEAAERGLGLNPASVARLVRQAPPVTWDVAARGLLTRLLAAGPGLVEVWETLDETGALSALLPEWDSVRLLPHATPVHRWTVDRHQVETCVAASALIRGVRRPDVLLLSALVHDVGKGESHPDHSVAGAVVATALARRIGLDGAGVAQVARLVRWHLLLPEVATTRDLDDPATVADVAERVHDVETLDLLLALTEADARATGPQAWTAWRARLVGDLAERTRRRLDVEHGTDGAEDDAGREAPPAGLRRPAAGTVHVEVEESPAGSRVVVRAPDRLRLIADVAAALALQRVTVRAARAWTDEQTALSVWDVEERGLDPAALRQRLLRVAAGEEDLDRLPRSREDRDPVVLTRPDASRSATVIEVRAGDSRGVVHRVCAALARMEVSVLSAHVGTVGPQAVDVFYLTESGAGLLSEERAATAVRAVRDSLAVAVG